MLVLCSKAPALNTPIPKKLVSDVHKGNYIIRIQIAEDVNVNTNILERGLEFRGHIVDGTGTPALFGQQSGHCLHGPPRQHSEIFQANS